MKAHALGGAALLAAWSVLVLTGCDNRPAPSLVRATPSSPAVTPPPDLDPPESEPLSREVEREIVGEHRRLKIKARVCLRELTQIGLECLLCLRGHKEHESLLKTNVDPEAIAEALRAVGAVPGAPPRYVLLQTEPGGPAKVSLRYEQGEKVLTVPTTWQLPPNQPFQFFAEYEQNGKTHPVPVTGTVSAGTRVQARLEYNDGNQFVVLPAVAFEAPAGPPLKLGLELTQNGKVTAVPALYAPAHGTLLKVTLQFEQNGKQLTVPASQWIRHGRTKTDLDCDFVFAGSTLVKPLDDGNAPVRLAASFDGAIICVCDVPTALIALPVWSPKGSNVRFFEPRTEVIPPVGHPVTVILEPVLPRK
jgi:hypothetical protein